MLLNGKIVLSNERNMEAFMELFSLKNLFYVRMETSSQNIYYQYDPDMGLWVEEVHGIPNFINRDDAVYKMAAMALLAKAKKIELYDTAHKLYQYIV